MSASNRLSMKKWVGKVAVVTGASSGIGAAIVKELVEEGMQVVGLARRKEKIEQLKSELKTNKENLHALKTDVSKEEDILQAFKWVEENIGPVQVLVNNAGFLNSSCLYNGKTEDWRTTIDVNLLGVAIATREAIAVMKKHKVNGHIIFMNSISGQYNVSLPFLNMYPSTKYGVTALANTLRRELLDFENKIKTTNISPGAVLTPMITIDNPAIADNLKKTPCMQPEDIADGVVYVLSTPPHVEITELTIKPVGETI